MERGLTKQQIIQELLRSPHRELNLYVPTAAVAAAEQAEFLAHLIAYDRLRGQVRDAKVALPVAAMIPGYPFVDNSLAHLALLSPRDLLRALRFAKTLNPNRPIRKIRRLVEAYLRLRESNLGWFNATALQHRVALHEMYRYLHVKPSEYADKILFKSQYPAGSVFDAVRELKRMSAQEAAGTVIVRKIPFLVAISALDRKPDEAFMLALIEQMSPAELISNTKNLEKWGMKQSAALRGAYDLALSRAATAKAGTTTFKATKAAEAVSDEKLKRKLVAAQEQQLQQLGGIDGNWLVLADKSPSMRESIDIARMVAATLAKMVKGQVSLVFFDSSPVHYDVTGKTYDEIKAMTAHVRDGGGGTSIGCGVRYALDRGFEPSGIAIVSDGAENCGPLFTPTYEELSKKLDRAIPVYLYWTKCFQPNNYNNNPDRLKLSMEARGHDLQVYDLRGGTDFYALPNIVQTMRANRYSLLDDIMSTPLLTVDEVLKNEGERHAA